MDRVKPERNLGAAKPPSAKGETNPPALMGLSHGTAGCGPACPVVWEGWSREAPPYPDCAEHVRQLEGESPFHNLMEVK